MHLRRHQRIAAGSEGVRVRTRAVLIHLQGEVAFQHRHLFVGRVPVRGNLVARRRLEPDHERPGLSRVTGEHRHLCALRQRRRPILPLQLRGVVHHMLGNRLRHR